MKITLTFDGDVDENFEERAKMCIDAERMSLAINFYYEHTFRKYKHAELTEEQDKLLEEIKDSLREHFEEFLED